MNTPKRNRARVLTPEGLKKLREQIRSHEAEQDAGTKYTLEKLGELTGLDPETVKNVLDCKGSDKRTIVRCFESFGLTLAESDHMAAAQAAVAPPDPNFVGREGAIADLDTLVSRNAKVIVIQARGGVGKTTLARKYLQQSFDSFLEFPIAKETKDIASIEGLIEEKLRQLGKEPGREFLVSLDRLKHKLQSDRIGILIDNLEPALDSAGRFIEAHRRYVELLRVLSDPTVQSVTLITSRERLREADVTVQHYPLRSLDATAWDALDRVSTDGRLYQALLKLGYSRQVLTFQKFVQQYPVAAFLIYGKSHYGQRWLLHRLVVQHMQDIVTSNIIKIDLHQVSRRWDVAELWQELSRHIGLSSQAVVSEIVAQVHQCWRSRNVLLVFNKVAQLPEVLLKGLLQDFWEPLATQAWERGQPGSPYKLLMFLVDDDGCVGNSSMTFADKRLEASWHPRIPVKLPEIREVTESELINWLKFSADDLPPTLTDDIDKTVQTIWANSDNGIPELVFSEICWLCGIDWHENEEKWLSFRLLQ